jgi:hypothetical protein
MDTDMCTDMDDIEMDMDMDKVTDMNIDMDMDIDTNVRSKDGHHSLKQNAWICHI